MFRYIEDLLLFFLVIYIVKGVFRNLLPFLFKAPNTGPKGGFGNGRGPFGPNMGGNPYNQSNPGGNSNSSGKPEGKIEVDYIPPKKDKKGGHFEGDFVDYEEIKK